jgi:hypothetical protein
LPRKRLIRKNQKTQNNSPGFPTLIKNQLRAKTGIIEKVEINGLLDLIYIIAGVENIGYVGLDKFDMFRPVGIEFRPEHGFNQSKMYHLLDNTLASQFF